MLINEIESSDIKSSTQPVSFEGTNLREFLKERGCEIAVTSTFKMYRGIGGELSDPHGRILVGNSAKVERASSGGYPNYFNLMTSYILPSWREYPKRSKSFICSTNVTTATQYGPVYQVYPVGNPEIAIAPRSDWWTSFQFDVPMFKKIFEAIARDSHLSLGDDEIGINVALDFANRNWQKLLDRTGSFEALDKTLTFYFSAYITERNLKPRDFKSLSAYLDAVCGPIQNKFRRKPLSTLSDTYYDKECWFTGPAYFVSLGPIKPDTTFDDIEF